MFMSDNGAEPDRRDLNPPISDQIGKAYDHSLDNLGSATSYVMYGPNWASAGATPFNRHKFTGFEGGMHVPAFVHFPKQGGQWRRAATRWVRSWICCRPSSISPVHSIPAPLTAASRC